MADKLTDVRARTAKPREKPYKFSAGRGLCLFVMPDGAKYWRFRYRYGGKEKMLSVGVYPIVTLKKADEKAEEPAHSSRRAKTRPNIDASRSSLYAPTWRRRSAESQMPGTSSTCRGGAKRRPKRRAPTSTRICCRLSSGLLPASRHSS